MQHLEVSGAVRHVYMSFGNTSLAFNKHRTLLSH